MGQLDGKIAFITGAGTGIGKGIARAYAREDAKLVLVARNKENWSAQPRKRGLEEQKRWWSQPT